jgi:hypothetical protein
VSAHAPPTTRAKKLVSFANVLAISSLDDDVLHLYPPLLDAFRSPSLIGRLVWDFFATVAGVGVAFTEIADTVPAAEQEALCSAVTDALTTWNPRGYNALSDFLTFVRQGVTRGAPLPTLIGTWIIRNVLPDHRPAAADLDLFSNAGSAIGMLFLRALHGWWQKKAPRREPGGPVDVHRLPLRPLVASSTSDSVDGCWGSSVTGRPLPFDAATAIVGEMADAIETEAPWATSHPSRNSAA